MPQERPQILIVTDVPFWRRLNGSHLRIASIVDALLGRECEVIVWYLSELSDKERELGALGRIRIAGPHIETGSKPRDMLAKVARTFAKLLHRQKRSSSEKREFEQARERAHAVVPPKRLDDFHVPAHKRLLKGFLKTIRPKGIVIEYLSLSYLLEPIRQVLPDSLCLLDAHDVMSQRATRLKELGQQNWLEVTREEETKAIANFDVLLAITNDDAEQFRQMIACDETESPNDSGDREGMRSPEVWLVGHADSEAGKFTKSNSNQVCCTLGFVGGKGDANLLAFQWFWTRVWLPLQEKRPAFWKLLIAGGIATRIQSEFGSELPGVTFEPHIDEMNTFFQRVDLAINPDQVRSGLKIKSVDAVSRGIPLLATSPASVGLESAIGKGVVVSDDAAEWLAILEDWGRNPESWSLQQGLAQLCRSDFSSTVVYHDFLGRLLGDLG